MDVHPTKNVSIGIDPYPHLKKGKKQNQQFQHPPTDHMVVGIFTHFFQHFHHIFPCSPTFPEMPGTVAASLPEASLPPCLIVGLPTIKDPKTKNTTIKIATVTRFKSISVFK